MSAAARALFLPRPRAVKPSSLPMAVWVPIAGGIGLGVAGLIGLLTHRLILFASLGPTSVMIVQQPLLASTKPYNSIVGHMIGLGAGFFAVWILGIAAQPSVFALHLLSGARVCAALLAIAIATGLEILLEAQHPPAASTTLLAALGSFRLDWTYAWEVLVGVVVVTATGELLRRLHPAPSPPGMRPPPRGLRPRSSRISR
jgi:HPP family